MTSGSSRSGMKMSSESNNKSVLKSKLWRIRTSLNHIPPPRTSISFHYPVPTPPSFKYSVRPPLRYTLRPLAFRSGYLRCVSPRSANLGALICIRNARRPPWPICRYHFHFASSYVTYKWLSVGKSLRRGCSICQWFILTKCV